MIITIPNHFRPVKPLRICLFAFLFACISYRLYNGAFLHLYLDTGRSLKSLFPFIIGKGTATERHFRSVLSPDIHSYRDSRTVVYDFNLGKKVLEPDGVKKEVLTVNGLFPGPTIEVRAGDALVVNVFNGLDQGTALHWHGIRHTGGSASQDGAIGITQCPIPPGQNYTYRFDISKDQSGTFWYHSHFQTQRADGLFGAFIIHPALSHGTEPRPSKGLLSGELKVRLGPSRIYARSFQESTQENSAASSQETTRVRDQVVLLGDWYYRSGNQVFEWYQSLRSAGKEPVPDSTLVNGGQAANCTKIEGLVKSIECEQKENLRIVVDPKKRNILRLINVGSQNTLHLSVDHHLLRLIEADGTRLEPMVVKEVPVALGQRYALELVPNTSLVNEGSIFWARYRINQDNMPYPNPLLDLESKIVLEYSSQPKATRTLQLPKTQAWDILESEELDPLSLLPLEENQRVLPTAEETVMMYVTSMIRSSTAGKPFGYVNQTSWKADLSNPVLSRPSSSLDFDSPTELIAPIRFNSSNVEKGKVVDIIVNNLEEDPHPFHLHGHHFWPLYTFQARLGKGSYRWDRPPELPTTAPALRDTFLVPQRGHAVFRVRFDTPGYWLFHCHMEVHLNSGMAMIFDVNGDEILAEERKIALDSCKVDSNV
ncbi:ferroxidase fet3 [Stygiomarasmius scandens]|uniref:laccase n=1 Tax=Marasmiellus scandens TaxID=2682957 RepID=A0ABR1JPT3_9AGAR